MGCRGETPHIKPIHKQNVVLRPTAKRLIVYGRRTITQHFRPIFGILSLRRPLSFWNEMIESRAATFQNDTGKTWDTLDFGFAYARYDRQKKIAAGCHTERNERSECSRVYLIQITALPTLGMTEKTPTFSRKRFSL